MTERLDKGLAFMLQYENVAWHDKNRVRILDRRIYPMNSINEHDSKYLQFSPIPLY